MIKLILKSFQSPGDLVMMTAAVRDLHRTFPGQFETDVRTSCQALWENNPYITPLKENADGVKVIDMHYPLVHRSNTSPFHFIHGYMDYLSRTLGKWITPTDFHGDIHLSLLEKSWMSQVEEIVHVRCPFWIIVAGGKLDFTAKWWIQDRWQQVVDRLKDKILFVQCGEKHHAHLKLTGVIDLVGKTNARQFIRLMHHASGVICPVTYAMHLAAAAPMRSTPPKNRPCVVIAGGREPAQWEAYPHHRFLSTNGCLTCCDNGGCWKSRTVPFGDGDEKDNSLCDHLVASGHFPKVQQCMDMISVDDVVRAVESYFIGGVCKPLDTSFAARFLS